MHVVSHRYSFAKLVKDALIGLSKLALLSRIVLLLANLSDMSSSMSLKLYPFAIPFFSRKNVFTKRLFKNTYSEIY